VFSISLFVLFVLFLLTIVWSAVLQLTDSDYAFGIFKHSFSLSPVLSSLDILTNDEELDLLSLYRMPNGCVIVLTNNAILLDLPKCPTKHLSILLTSNISKPGWTVTVKRDTKEVVRIRRGPWKIQSTYNKHPSFHAMAFKQWSLYPLNNYSTLFTTWQIKRIKNDKS